MADQLAAAVKDTVEEAGRLALEHYGRCDFTLKPDHSVVTAADHAVDTFLGQRLPQLLPGSAYLGEETCRATPIARRTAEAGYLWVVDPIDGTAGFTDGLDTFCVCVGLLRQGQPYAGVVYFPALNHWYTGWPGQGACYDGRPVRVLDAEPVLDRAVLYVDAKAHLDYRLSYRGKTRSMASTALHYLLVARGVAVGAVSTAHIWDYAAAVAILELAGGRFRHLDGREVCWLDWLDGRNIHPPVLGAPPPLWDAVAATIVHAPGATSR
jgi:myo-inositol-1(or 4)-monophosphatase